MTFTEFLFLIVGLGAGVIVGFGLACHLLKKHLKVKPGMTATTLQTAMRALGGGGPGPVDQ